MKDGCLCIRTPKIHTQIIIRILRLNQTKRVHSLKLSASTTLISLGFFISLGPHRIRSILQLKLRQPLPKSKDMLRVDFKINLNILILINEGLPISINHGIASSCICELEGEWLFPYLQIALIKPLPGIIIRFIHHILRNTIPSHI